MHTLFKVPYASKRIMRTRVLGDFCSLWRRISSSSCFNYTIKSKIKSNLFMIICDYWKRELEDWKKGLEDWKIGVPSFHPSTLPLFHSSTLPLFHPSTLLLFHSSTLPLFHPSTLLLFHPAILSDFIELFRLTPHGHTYALSADDP